MAAAGSSGQQGAGPQTLENGTLLTDNHAFQSGEIVVHNEELVSFAGNEPLCRLFSHNYGQGPKEVRVLNVLGVRIFRGLMSCVLKAHEANLAYKGSFSVKVSVFKRDRKIVPETAGVRIIIDEGVVPCETDTGARKKDYRRLGQIIQEAFTKGGRLPLHMAKIHAKLGTLAADRIDPPNASTQLLQALVATVDPLIMATMWWKLVRFQESLGPKPSKETGRKTTTERTDFDMIVNRSPVARDGWNGLVLDNLFKNTTTIGPATDLLSIARNWFTHYPEENGAARFSLQNNRAARSQQNPAKKLHELDYYFSTHFPNFMADVLIKLYDDSTHRFHTNDLTRALLPY